MFQSITLKNTSICLKTTQGRSKFTVSVMEVSHFGAFRTSYCTTGVSLSHCGISNKFQFKVSFKLIIRCWILKHQFDLIDWFITSLVTVQRVTVLFQHLEHKRPTYTTIFEASLLTLHACREIDKDAKCFFCVCVLFNEPWSTGRSFFCNLGWMIIIPTEDNLGWLLNEFKWNCKHWGDLNSSFVYLCYIAGCRKPIVEVALVQCDKSVTTLLYSVLFH